LLKFLKTELEDQKQTQCFSQSFKDRTRKSKKAHNSAKAITLESTRVLSRISIRTPCAARS
jgi:hypothetical protein